MSGPSGEAGLRALLLQAQRSGTRRRAILLHTDRLPVGLSKPHHVRLAREALGGLMCADRAQHFELARGRVAIVWRCHGGGELETARSALGQLLAGHPDGQVPSVGEMLTLYDLPSQAAWLLDEISEEAPEPEDPVALPALDAAELACLEAVLAQSDLTRFLRWRPVLALTGARNGPVWEERFFAVADIAANLCPDRNITADKWLFRRLTRTLDRRMLAILAAPRELRGCAAFAIALNVETVLSPAFLRFDGSLPLALRGAVILNLNVSDILADPAGFLFAARFAQSRQYRLALAGASLRQLELLDLTSVGLDYVHLYCSTGLMAAPGVVAGRMPVGARIVLSGLDHASELAWATRQGFAFGSGAALSQ